jgi:hypothetical protein
MEPIDLAFVERVARWTLALLFLIGMLMIGNLNQ